MKKKILIIILFIVLCAGCSLGVTEKPKITKEENQKKEYVKYVKELNKIDKSSEDLPFNVEVKFDKLTDEEIRYQVIIDNQTKDINDIKAIAIHDKQTDDVFPSIGIFDDTVNLIMNEKPEGVILVGYIPYEGLIDDFKCEIKLLISYKVENEEYTSYYVTKK